MRLRYRWLYESTLRHRDVREISFLSRESTKLSVF